MTNKYHRHIIGNNLGKVRIRLCESINRNIGYEYHLSLIIGFMEVTVDNSVVLSVGDKFHLRLGKDRIYYGGMPSEKVFSIVQRKKGIPYMGFAWNLYFPRGQSRIRIDGVNIQVESVSPEEIRLII